MIAVEIPGRVESTPPGICPSPPHPPVFSANMMIFAEAARSGLVKGMAVHLDHGTRVNTALVKAVGAVKAKSTIYTHVRTRARVFFYHSFLTIKKNTLTAPTEPIESGTCALTMCLDHP
jgi:hypothetical protein